LGFLPSHNQYHYASVRFVYLLIFGICFAFFAPVSAQTVSISKSDISYDDRTIFISDTWKFSPGDNQDWAQAEYQDSSWQHVSTYLGPSELPFIDWEGIGWFRLKIKPDSSLTGVPLALLVEQHNGASEVYLDGKLIHQLGSVSDSQDNTEATRSQQPLPFVLPDTSAHVLAVRFANHEAKTFNDKGFTAGFRFLIGELDYHVAQSVQGNSNVVWLRLFFTGLLLAFTIIHSLLYLFYPKEKRNLYFAVFTGFLTLLTYTILESDFTLSPMAAIIYHQISLVIWVLTGIYALRFSYSLFYKNLPKLYWVFFIMGIGVAAGSWLNTQSFSFYRELFVFVTTLEILRVLVISFFRKRDGIWLIGTGLIIFTIGILYTILANLNVVAGDPVLGNLYGATGLVLGMSVFLSRDFARINKNLNDKLEEVEELSERALRQERINREKELERKLLEAENERKSSELEKARTLQLSMLPKNVPDSDYWNIAVYMKTAQEVGGDYYDFAFDQNRTMTVALGDATGHGMKSGIVVATAKSYFHTLANENDVISILRKMSSGIRNMDLRMMYMSMLFLKCNKHSVEYTSAGMPPILHYKARKNKIDQVLVKGLPLGANADFPYEKLTIDTEPEDVLLLMSDGLSELFDHERNMLGMDRITDTFKSSAQLTAEEIIERLIQRAESWAGKDIQQDDITLMVLKAKILNN
jgi:serine phosphatase RsbU (regulator of sigma subunit)